MEHRGRPTENTEVKNKWVMKCYEVPSKPEIGSKTVYHFDRSKNSKGPYKVEHTPAKGERAPKIQIQKQQTYNKMPVAIVFKTSSKPNAKVKMKVWNNTNIDFIVSSEKLLGVPEKAEILELAVGHSFIEKFKEKYGL